MLESAHVAVEALRSFLGADFRQSWSFSVSEQPDKKRDYALRKWDPNGLTWQLGQKKWDVVEL